MWVIRVVCVVRGAAREPAALLLVCVCVLRVCVASAALLVCVCVCVCVCRSEWCVWSEGSGCDSIAEGRS